MIPDVRPGHLAALLALALLAPTAARAVAPLAPSDLVATPLSSTSIALDWTDNSTNEDSFRVESKSVGDFQQVGTLPAGSSHAVLFNLQPSTPYTFRIRACAGSDCSAYSNEAKASTLASDPDRPAAPANLTAVALSGTQVELTWEDRSNDETDFRIEARTDGDFSEVAAAPENATSAVAARLTPSTAYTFRVRAHNQNGFSDYSNTVTLTTPDRDVCVPGEGTLCLLSGRFRVSVDWRDQHNGGETGVGHAIPSTDQSGYFWFFDSGNVELVVKVLDGRSINHNFWFFYGGLSDVDYTITVDDTAGGESRTYHNPPGRICGDADLAAFGGGLPRAASLPATEAPVSALRPIAAAAGASGSCIPGEETLCLADGRFAVQVDWTDQHNGGGTGVGHAVPYTDQTGFFWFFDADNIELVLKVLDARSFTGHFWVFYGALSDVNYRIHVRDTVSGVERTFENPPGEICGAADVTTF